MPKRQPHNPDIHHRRSIRLPGYDYSLAGAYFVTICTHNREWLFGEIIDGEMQLNPYGEIAQSYWKQLSRHHPDVELDVFVTMPNHLHSIIFIKDNPHAQCPGLPEIIRGFKTFSARCINQKRGLKGVPVWQRNYYDHIIRNEQSLARIRQYIVENPLRWAEDPENQPQKS